MGICNERDFTEREISALKPEQMETGRRKIWTKLLTSCMLTPVNTEIVEATEI